MTDVLHQFLFAQRAKLIDRCRSKVALRPVPRATPAELDYGIPLFLDQLIRTLRVEQAADAGESRKISGPSGGSGSVLSEIGVGATRHGRELLHHGFTVDQVVHDYGDLCQAITEVAFEDGTLIQVDEFHTLNRCLDNAIADAVTEFAYHRDLSIADMRIQAFNERLGFLAHELRNLLQNATLAVAAIKSGTVGLTGATGAVLDRSLSGMRTLIDSSLADVRVTAGIPARHELISLADFIAEVKVSVSLDPRNQQHRFKVSDVDPRLAVDADPDMLFAAVGNLLQNAFKFSKRHSDVTLSAYASADRILIDVADGCGGLPGGDAERMFLPFTQNGGDKSGLGLGLTICRRTVEANHGTLSVRDVPGSGCVFTMDLPRHEIPLPASVAPIST